MKNQLWRLNHYQMKKFKLIFFLSLFFFSNISSYAINNDTKLDEITKNLRCLICQGQSVYDSQSDFAISMKLIVKKKLDEGKKDKEIYEYLKKKYGEWIVYDPELNQNTLLLWSIPLILFVFGGLLIIRKVSIK